VAERIAVESYSEVVRWLGERDVTSRKLMADILMVEERHAADMQRLLVNYTLHSVSRLRFSPKSLNGLCRRPHLHSCGTEGTALVGVAHPALYISNQFRRLRHVENC
jgi:hypothetical protein